MFAIHSMNLAGIDLNLLVALDALITEAHVCRAARRIGLSQPAASHALNRLRVLLQDPLLVRAGSRMQLTPRAVGLREPLADALRRVQTLLATEGFEPATSSRQFLLMMQDHIAQFFLPELVKRVHSRAPGVRLDVLPWQSAASMKPERLRSIDLLISCSASEIVGFERNLLFADTEVTVVRKGHPMASRLKNLSAFLRSRHVAVAGKGLREDPVDTWLREQHLERSIALRVPSYLQALQTVAATDLVAFVPKRLAESMAKPLSLVVLRPPIDPGAYQEYLFQPRRTASDPGSNWLRELALGIGRQLDHKGRQALVA